MIERIRDYKIIKKLGEGGMGTVYLARDEMLEREVAIKILDPILTKDSQFTDRFRHEAKVQASLIHPNIVTLYNYFYEDNNYCMVMEYIDGVTLKQLITSVGPLPEQRAIWIFNQMLEAVGYAHKKGIIHRDIKPSNILITGDDTVKILDFGIAKILQDKGLTKTGTKMGTIYYMSPEQIKAVKDIDNRTDIYSLGVTFYEMLSGRVPFNVDTDSDFEIMNEIVSGEIKDPRQYYPHISQWVVDVLFESVQKDRDKRIKSTDDFRKRLLAKEGKPKVVVNTDKTIIDQPATDKTDVPPEKPTVAKPGPSPTPKAEKPKQPVKPVVSNKPEDKKKPPVSSKPADKKQPVKKKSSKGKLILFGLAGIVTVAAIYFLLTKEPGPQPIEPDDPVFFGEDSINSDLQNKAGDHITNDTPPVIPPKQTTNKTDKKTDTKKKTTVTKKTRNEKPKVNTRKTRRYSKGGKSSSVKQSASRRRRR